MSNKTLDQVREAAPLPESISYFIGYVYTALSAARASASVVANVEREADRLMARALASLPEGAPNPDSDHPAGLVQGASSGGGENAHVLDPDSDDAQGLAAPPGWWRGHNTAMESAMDMLAMPMALLQRLSQWDQMNPPMTPDHAYWKREIDEMLKFVEHDDWKPRLALHAKPVERRVIDGGENGEAGSTKGSKGAAIDEATKP